MSSIIKVHVPRQLEFALFFPESTVSMDLNEMKEWKHPHTFTAFPYDFAFFQGVEAYRPWEDSEKYAPILLKEWKKIKTECQTLFSERKTKQTLEPMKEGIALFFTFIYWIHNRPVELREWNQIVDVLPIKPVNLVERLAFIIQRPALYHSFVQLSELFHEVEKHYVKSIIKKSPRQ